MLDTETHFKLNNKKNMQKQKINTSRPGAPNGRNTSTRTHTPCHLITQSHTQQCTLHTIKDAHHQEEEEQSTRWTPAPAK